MALGKIVDEHEPRAGALNEMLGISAADVSAAGNVPPEAPTPPSEAESLGAEFRDPEVQDRILNPPVLELDSEVFVTDWVCRRKHVTSAYDTQPPGVCGHPNCSLDVVADFERVQIEKFTLRLAFTDHDVRRRKVWEHVEALRQVFLREMVADNPRAQLEEGWMQRNPRTMDVGASAVATLRKTRETLMYLSGCPWEVVEGLDSMALQVALFRLITAYREWAEERLKKTREAAGSRSGTPPSALNSGGMAGPRTS